MFPKRSFTRKQALAGLAGGAGAVLAACGGPRAQERAVPTLAKEPVQISYLTDWDRGPRLKMIEDAFALWHAKNPHVRVDVRHGGSVQEKLLAEIVAGTQPDAALYSTEGIASLRTNFEDLTPFIKREKINMKDFVSVDPALLHDGGQYGMPFQSNMNLWHYNRTLFEREGVAPPTEKWTWNDMAEAARRLNKPDQQQWGIEICCPISRFMFTDLVVSNGGAFTSKDNRRTLLNSPEAAEAGRWVVERVQRDRVVVDADTAKTVLTPGLMRAFQTGRVGMIYINASSVGAFDASVGFSQFEWDVMAPPRAPRTGKGVHQVGGQVGDQPNAILKRPGRSAAQADAAWALTAFLSGPEVMGLIAEARISIPVHREVLMGPRYLRKPPASMPLIPQVLGSAWYGVPWFKGIGEWRTAVHTALDAAWTGQSGVDDALRAASAAGDAKLAELGTRG